MKKGRKVVFGQTGSNDKSESHPNNVKSLIIPALLKISESLKVSIGNVNASIIANQGSKRR